jgi:hypothetical protein
LPSSQYWFKVTATNIIGISNFSEPIGCWTLKRPTVPSAPYGISFIKATNSTIEFSWKFPYDGGSEI